MFEDGVAITVALVFSGLQNFFISFNYFTIMKR